MAKSKPTTAPLPVVPDALQDQDQTRLRAFLSKVRPLSGSTGHEDLYWEGRSLIEGLALNCELGLDDDQWSLEQCGAVLKFLTVIEPVKGECYCGGFDREAQGISITCGHHIILESIGWSLQRLAEPANKRKGAA